MRVTSRGCIVETRASYISALLRRIAQTRSLLKLSVPSTKSNIKPRVCCAVSPGAGALLESEIGRSKISFKVSSNTDLQAKISRRRNYPKANSLRHLNPNRLRELHPGIATHSLHPVGTVHFDGWCIHDRCGYSTRETCNAEVASPILGPRNPTRESFAATRHFVCIRSKLDRVQMQHTVYKKSLLQAGVGANQAFTLDLLARMLPTRFTNQHESRRRNEEIYMASRLNQQWKERKSGHGGLWLERLALLLLVAACLVTWIWRGNLIELGDGRGADEGCEGVVWGGVLMILWGFLRNGESRVGWMDLRLSNNCSRLKNYILQTMHFSLKKPWEAFWYPIPSPWILISNPCGCIPQPRLRKPPILPHNFFKPYV